MSRSRVITLIIVVGLALLVLLAVGLGLGERPGPGGEAEVDHPEVYEVLPKLRVAEDTFHKALGDWENLTDCPPGPPGPALALEGDCLRKWAGLGVEDPGPLQCRYRSFEDGRVEGVCDLDGDGVLAVYTLAPGGEITRVSSPDAR